MTERERQRLRQLESRAFRLSRTEQAELDELRGKARDEASPEDRKAVDPPPRQQRQQRAVDTRSASANQRSARARADVSPWDPDRGKVTMESPSFGEAVKRAMQTGSPLDRSMPENTQVDFSDRSMSIGTEGMGFQLATSNRRTMSALEAMLELHRLSEDDLIHVQAALFDAGLYSGAFRWGQVDPATREAFQILIGETLLGAGKTVEQVLETLINSNIDSLRGRLGEYDPETGQQVSGEGVSDAKPSLSDPNALADRADQIGRDILGRQLTEDEERLVVSIVGGREAEQAGSVSGVPGGPDPEELDAFMRALGGRESGGDPTAVNARTGAHGTFQIMPSNWAAWATRAGLPSTAPRTPENQERVARVILSDYYRQHKNWRDVAIAWYAGPGAWAKERRRPGFFDQPQGRGNEPSVRRYADDVMTRFQRERVYDIGTERGEQQYDIQTGLETEVAALDPTRAALGDVDSRMEDFFSLLGGP